MGSEERPQEIVSGVYRLGTKFVNWYLVEDGGKLTAVDAALSGYRDGLESGLRALGRSLSDIEAVVLTHSDADHTGLIPAMREGGAGVHIHPDDRQTLARPGPKKGDASPRHQLGTLRHPATWRIFSHLIRHGAGKPPKVEGAQTFGDGEVLDVPGKPRVVHTPGHTPGHSVVHLEEKRVVFTGDALVTWDVIHDNRGAQLMPRPLNVDTAGALESLAKIEPLNADVVLPGHGEPLHESPFAAVAEARTRAD